MADSRDSAILLTPPDTDDGYSSGGTTVLRSKVVGKNYESYEQRADGRMFTGDGDSEPLAIGEQVNQLQFLQRHAALLSTARSAPEYILHMGDSHSRLWAYPSAGGVLSWVEQTTLAIQGMGIPASCDWRLATATTFGRGQNVSSTGTVTAGTTGPGFESAILAAGATWSTTFGGTNEPWYEVPGDGVDLYVTMKAAAGATISVMIDGVIVQASTTTTDATPGATLGFRKFYSSGLLDGKAHTITVTNTHGSQTAEIEGAFIHHGTTSAGVRWINGSHNGSRPQHHLDAGGFQSALTVLEATNQLGLVVVACGLIAWDTALRTGNDYVTDLQNSIDAVRARTLADIMIFHEIEPAGALGALTTSWQSWGSATLSRARDVAYRNKAAFASAFVPVGGRANSATTAKNVDIWTLPTTGPTGIATALTTDYLHPNNKAHAGMRTAAWPVISAGMPPGGQPVYATVLNQVSPFKPVYDTGVARTTSTAEGTLLAAPISIPANTLAVGDEIRIIALVNGLQITGGTTTLRVRLKVGGTTIFDGLCNVISGFGSGTNIVIEANLLVDSTVLTSFGVRGSAQTNGVGAPLTFPNIITNSGVVTPTSSAWAIDVTSEMSVSSSNNASSLLGIRVTIAPRF